jgi:hypothetical protein
MDTLVDIHSWLRWLVLIAVGGGTIVGFVSAAMKREWIDVAYAVAAIIVDVQVTLGIILWVFNQGWELGFFIAVIHPIFMLAAVAVIHITVRRARAQGGSPAHMTAAVGLLISLVLIVAAIPWQRL